MFTCKTVQKITGERADTQCSYCVAGKNDTDCGIAGTEYFGQVKGKYRYQQPESEIQQEVGCENKTITGSNKFIFHSY